MATLVCTGAMLKCSFGTAPGTLTVPASPVLGAGPPAANVLASAPGANIAPFGNCTSPTNPAVIAAQGAPAPCVPATPAPWAPGSAKVQIGGMPALNDTSTLTCLMGGVIQVSNAGQTSVMVA